MRNIIMREYTHVYNTVYRQSVTVRPTSDPTSRRLVYRVRIRAASRP